MLNRNKAGREAARVLLGLSMAQFDGEDGQAEPKVMPQRLARAQDIDWRALAWFMAGVGFLAMVEWLTKRFMQ